ncbi:MAG: PD-(D/E)XK nuclease domain-containing protein, partial [Dysgonamonadaceae bacterium]|nr:PD-(D/E)XK nuclease domain-containing protein [Dysgonamonadaceae bacterium]
YSELLPVYMGGKHSTTEFYAANFVRDLQDSNVEGFMTRLRAFFADIPNVLENKREKHYHTIFFVLFRLMGQFVEAEYNSAVGRADAVVITKTTVYVFEFKMSGNGTAEDALRQIDDKKYMLPFTASGKNLVKIGVEFSGDKDERNVARWVVG